MARNAGLKVAFRLALFGGLALVGSGCANGPAYDDAPESDAPTLASFAKCDFRYPDNSPVPCENQATSVSIFGAAPGGSVCVEQAPGEYWRFWLNPATGKYWFEYDSKVTFDIWGLLRLDSGSDRFLYDWFGEPSGAFEIADGLGPRAKITTLIYFFSANTSNLELSSADTRQLWSLYGEDFWAIHEFDVGTDSYFFANNQLREDIREATREEVYEPTSFHVAGRDFELGIFLGKIVFGGTANQVDILAPDPSCVT